MNGPLPVRNPAELGVGDVVLTPSGRQAQVVKHRTDCRVSVAYVDEFGFADVLDGCDLYPKCLRLVRKATPATQPGQGFFDGVDAVRAGRD